MSSLTANLSPALLDRWLPEDMSDSGKGNFDMTGNTNNCAGTWGRFLVVFSLWSAIAFAGPVLTVVLDPTSLVGQPGMPLTFTGTIMNASGSEMFLNGAGGNVSSPELTLDLTPFFTLTPLSLLDGEIYNGVIFSVAISSVALSGSYFGTFTIQGGVDALAFDDVGIADFQITVGDSAAVPEQSSGILVLIAVVVLVVRRKLRGQGK